MSLPNIEKNGWSRHNSWEHSTPLDDLYRARARDEAEEMTCAAQAAEILMDLATKGDSVIDVGCGAGHFFHSLRRRDAGLKYAGFDATAKFIDMGREELSHFDAAPEMLQTLRLEDFAGTADHVLCMNVLTYLDGFERPLERMLQAARKSLVLRESIRPDGPGDSIYVRDDFLDKGVDICVPIHTFDGQTLVDFAARYGFDARLVTDRRSSGEAEDVIGYPHYWTFLVAVRRT